MIDHSFPMDSFFFFFSFPHHGNNFLPSLLLYMYHSTSFCRNPPPQGYGEASEARRQPRRALHARTRHRYYAWNRLMRIMPIKLEHTPNVSIQSHFPSNLFFACSGHGRTERGNRGQVSVKKTFAKIHNFNFNSNKKKKKKKCPRPPSQNLL